MLFFKWRSCTKKHKCFPFFPSLTLELTFVSTICYQCQLLFEKLHKSSMHIATITDSHIIFTALSYVPSQLCSCCFPARAAECHFCCVSWTWPPSCWALGGQRLRPAVTASEGHHVWGPALVSSLDGQFHPGTGRCLLSCLWEEENILNNFWWFAGNCKTNISTWELADTLTLAQMIFLIQLPLPQFGSYTWQIPSSKWEM